MLLDPMVNRAHASLENYPEVKAYLTKRKITQEDINKYRLGYTVAPYMPAMPEDEDYLALKEETRDFFFWKKRLIIPLENPVGGVNGLVVRVMEEDAKNRYRQFLTKEASQIGAMFGLPQAFPHIVKEGVVYVTEGAIDCISLAKAFPNTVSTLTSFVNEEQMWVLRQIADTIVLVFDPDKPGRDGVEIVMNKYGKKGLFSREFGNGDPNHCLVTMGEEKFKAFAKKSLAGIINFKRA
jgi:DNA primase